jgi:protein SCO1/2
LIEAAQNKIGTPVDQILLFCYHWDPSTGKYTPIAIGGLRIAAGATLLLIGGFFFVNFRREARERASTRK